MIKKVYYNKYVAQNSDIVAKTEVDGEKLELILEYNIDYTKAVNSQEIKIRYEDIPMFQKIFKDLEEITNDL